MQDLNERVRLLRSVYNEVKAALPWLDASVWENDKISFEGFNQNIATPSVRAANLDLSLEGRLPILKNKIHILRFNPLNGPLDSFRNIFPEMSDNNIPLTILHTNIGFDDIRRFASENPRLKIILESGPRKILYAIKEIKNLLKQCDNVYLCTYNFCNWYGHEESCRIGLGNKLLFGSHMPEYIADASMGPVIISDLDWETKCDIAGNNLRRLLGITLLYPPEVKYKPVEAFVIDSHAHNLQYGNGDIYKMPTPDLKFQPSDWIQYMDLCSVDKMFLIPGEMLDNTAEGSVNYLKDVLDYREERFYFYEIFDPSGDHIHIEKLKISLQHPHCIGIKIHPTFHKTDADDDSYESVYRIAEELNKPIMTHSWGISSYNHEQYRSHPDRFRRYLKNFRKNPFILGHAGGRPSSFEATLAVCRDFSNVYVDLAGDYYNNGLIDILASRIGAGRILFASDVNWMDTRCNLAPVLASGLSDKDVLKILRLNALKIFRDGI